MRNQRFLLKLAGIFKSYLLLILIAVLMLSQLFSISSIFKIDSVSNLISFIFISTTTDFYAFGLFILMSFLACCCIWYSYRPIVLFYLFLKDKLSVFNFIFKKFSFRFSLSQIRNGENDPSKPNNQYYWISRLANKISNKLNITSPKIVIDKSTDINAKVLPGFIHSSLIVLTQGLLDKLTPDEIEAVIAHELAHEAMQDTFSMSVTDLLILLTIWMPVYFLHLVIDYVFLFKWRNKNIGFIFSLFLVLICYGFFPLFILNTINRRYELRADKIAMQSTNLQSFLSALNAVHESQAPMTNPLEWCLASMPKAVRAFALRTFLSHPSIPTRIQALQ